MLGSIDPESADRQQRLRECAQGMIRVCDTALQDAIDTLAREWEGEAASLLIARMAGARGEIVKNAGRLIWEDSL